MASADSLTSVDAADRERLAEVRIDEASLPPADSSQAHERLAAVHDLLDDNRFVPLIGGGPHQGGPYTLTLALRGGQLGLDIRTEAGEPVAAHLISLTPFRTILRDYRRLCASFEDAAGQANLQVIETLDMARRSLHDHAGAVLVERLAGKVAIDLPTGRRLFSLLDAMASRG